MTDWQQTIGWLFSGREISLLLKTLYTLFVCALIPIYWRYYGPANFLWFSDLALLLTVAALWLESPLLASMQVVSVLLLELLWIVDFVTRLASGVELTGLADYMFKADKPLFVRALSLFHLVLPFLLLWLVCRLGYDRRAWVAQSIMAWLVLLVCYFFTEPSENVNWVFGPGNRPQLWIAPELYLVLLLLFFPLCIYLPTHLLVGALIYGISH
ncbi:MAG TPA: membrane-associated protein [Acidobacteriota bacterium]|jgi:hypothetical protein